MAKKPLRDRNTQHQVFSFDVSDDVATWIRRVKADGSMNLSELIREAIRQTYLSEGHAPPSIAKVDRRIARLEQAISELQRDVALLIGALQDGVDLEALKSKLDLSQGEGSTASPTMTDDQLDTLGDLLD